MLSEEISTLNLHHAIIKLLLTMMIVKTNMLVLVLITSVSQNKLEALAACSTRS